MAETSVTNRLARAHGSNAHTEERLSRSTAAADKLDTAAMNRLALASMIAFGVVAARANGDAQGAPPASVQVLSLADALQYAADHYPSVRAALEQVQASSAGIDVARAASLPRLDAVWQMNRATANNVFGQVLPQSVIPALTGPVLPTASSSSVWGSAAGALVSWEPIDFGQRSTAVREAEAGVARARAEHALTRLEVQRAAGAAYLAVISAQQALAAAEADVERRQVLARAARTLADNQLRPGAEASRADAERAAAQTRAIQARQGRIVAEATLRRLLGATTIVSVDGARLLATVPQRLPPVSGPPQSGSARSGSAGSTATHPLPQVRQTLVELDQTREAVLSKTYRPRLYLQSSVFARGTGANPDGAFDGGADGLGLDRANWAAGLQVVLPNLFELASLRARRAAAAAATRADRARYDEALLAVASEQQTADALAEAASAVALNTPVQLDAARASEAQARARYEAGLASIVEIAEAQSLLAQAEYQHGAAQVDVWRAALAQAVAAGDVAPLIARLRDSGH
jgi:outer membrane protein